EAVRHTKPEPRQAALRGDERHREPVATGGCLVGDVCRDFALYAGRLVDLRQERASGPGSDKAPSGPSEERLVQVMIVRIAVGARAAGRRRALHVAFIIGKLDGVALVDEAVGAVALTQ